MVHRYPFKDLRRAYAVSEFSPVDVVRSALSHAAAVNLELNAFSWLDDIGAMETAHASALRWQQGVALSPLDGMPVAIKESASVQGWPTRRGSLVTDNAPALQDSVFVARLRAAGAVLLGKTRAPEFNWKGVTDSRGFGVTRNPLNPDRTPGGSSGGCSAAVAAGVVRVSIGSDAAGSVRIPAAFTGVLGLKPTTGRIPLVPFPSQFSGLAHLGPLGASAADLMDVLAIMAGPSPGDWTSTLGNARSLVLSKCQPSKLRVGVVEPDCLGWMDDSVRKGLEHMEARLTEAGLTCKSVSLDVLNASEAAVHLYRLGCVQALAGLSADARQHVDPGLLAYETEVASLTLHSYRRTLATRDCFAAQVMELFETVDVLLLPTVPILPFVVGRNVPPGWPSEDWLSWNPYTPAFNLVSSPVLNYPVRMNDNFPVGVQFVAPPLEEMRLLALGDWLDTAYKESENCHTAQVLTEILDPLRK